MILKSFLTVDRQQNGLDLINGQHQISLGNSPWLFMIVLHNFLGGSFGRNRYKKLVWRNA